ncbi:hypothetical protein D3C72_1267940 [compost metagenome]
MAAFQAHVVPFAGAQGAGEVAQAIVLAAMADHAGYRWRAAGRAEHLGVGFHKRAFRQRQQPVAEGDLQGGADEWCDGWWQEVELAAQEANAPRLALGQVGLLKLLQGLGDGGVGGRLEARQQGVECGQPAIGADQGFEGDWRHAVLAAAGKRFGCRAWQLRWVVQHLLLGLAEVGDQLEVASQGMAFGEFAQARGALAEQVVAGQVEEGRDVGGRFDLAGFEYLAWHAGLLQ